MITELIWDSKCFGYPVGKLMVEEGLNYSLDEIAEFSNGYKLIYVFSKNEITIENSNFFLADKKVVLERETELLIEDYSSIKSYQGNVSYQLLKLTFESGLYSRFKMDNLFINDEFHKLYTEWIKKSVNRSIASDVFVYTEKDEVLGFITLADKNGIADIGLIAVDSKYRARGIATLLIKYAMKYAIIHGFNKIQVVTQLENDSAIALYHRNGFIIQDLTYIYHYWNK